MNNMTDFSFQRFQLFLSEAKIRSLQIIHIGIGMGVIMFFCVVEYLWTQNDLRPEALSSGTFLIVLSAIHAFVALGGWVASRIIFEKIITQNIQNPNGETETGSSTKEEAFYNLYRKATIVRLAMLEAPALFGLVICMIAVMDGAIYLQPLYWINALSSFQLLAVIAKSFPTKEKIETMVRERFTLS